MKCERGQAHRHHHQARQTGGTTLRRGAPAPALAVRCAQGFGRRQGRYYLADRREVGSARVRLLLDTDVVVWLVEGMADLRTATRAAIDRAASQNGVLISAISFWEVAMLAAHDRLALSLPAPDWRDRVLSLAARRRQSRDLRRRHRSGAASRPVSCRSGGPSDYRHGEDHGRATGVVRPAHLELWPRRTPCRGDGSTQERVRPAR